MDLLFRSEILKAIRKYFYSTSVIEVVTPVLQKFASSEVFIESIEVENYGYLHTSPEHAMKHLLSKYKDSIFQICPVFRANEIGSFHKEEFQMLEWYRSSFDLTKLLEETEKLLRFVLKEITANFDCAHLRFPFQKISYKSLFLNTFSENPHTVSLKKLFQLSRGLNIPNINHSRSECLDFLFALKIQPKIVAPTFVFDYPVCQAAQSEISFDDEGEKVANRFELFIEGVELANAYQELRDPGELLTRFNDNNAIRRLHGKKEVPVDYQLLESLPLMPKCAGASLGIDRLMKIISGSPDINKFYDTD
ncbi:MAG: EF-P lysine aminoacylase EpmA [Candidatus Azotimanducaceae bacterium]